MSDNQLKNIHPKKKKKKKKEKTELFFLTTMWTHHSSTPPALYKSHSRASLCASSTFNLDSKIPDGYEMSFLGFFYFSSYGCVSVGGSRSTATLLQCEQIIEREKASECLQFVWREMGGWCFLSSLWFFTLSLHWCWVWLPKIWQTWYSLSQVLLATWFLQLTQVLSRQIDNIKIILFYINPYTAQSYLFME